LEAAVMSINETTSKIDAISSNKICKRPPAMTDHEARPAPGSKLHFRPQPHAPSGPDLPSSLRRLHPLQQRREEQPPTHPPDHMGVHPRLKALGAIFLEGVGAQRDDRRRSITR